MNETLCCLLFGLLWIIPPFILIGYWIKLYTAFQKQKLDNEFKLERLKIKQLKAQNKQLNEANKRNKLAEHLKFIIEEDFKKEGNKPDIKNYIKELSEIYKFNDQTNE